MHGNVLNNTPAECYALICRETGVIKKYGETIHGELKYGIGNQRRYPRSYLDEHNLDYKQIEFGTKKDMHQLQHQLIEEYEVKYGKTPDDNINGW